MDRNIRTLLVRHALVSEAQIARAALFTHEGGTTWLEELLLSGLLDEERLCACVSAETGLPRCGREELAHLRDELVTTIPAEVATEHRVVPLGVQADGRLRVAMVDPLDSRAFEEVQFFSGRRLVREVALASSIAWALHQYFGAPVMRWLSGPETSRHG
jgi:Type II secretion system (T2SS), protein E, N-terminal domain